MSQQDPLGFQVTRFDTRTEFHALLVEAMRSAQREVWMADADYSEWPLNRPEVESILHEFLLASRSNRLHLLVHKAQKLQNDAPRFMRLLRTFSHSIVCREAPEHLAVRFADEFSMIIVDRARLVRRFHRDGMRGVAELNPNAVGAWVDQYQSVWDESLPGLSATTLGLSG